MEQKKKMDQIVADVPVYNVDGKRVMNSKTIAQNLAESKKQSEAKTDIQIPDFDYFLHKQMYGEDFEYIEEAGKVVDFPMVNSELLDDDALDEVDSERLDKIKGFLSTLSPMIKDGTKIISRIKPKDRGPKR